MSKVTAPTDADAVVLSVTVSQAEIMHDAIEAYLRHGHATVDELADLSRVADMLEQKLDIAKPDWSYPPGAMETE